MKLIPLSQGQFAQVDDEDYENLNRFKWHADKHGNTFYAKRKVQVNKKIDRYYMHRQILNVGMYEVCDHKDGNGLNNQRYNIRVCTQANNTKNQKPRNGYSSQFKGVFFHKASSKWTAQIKVNYKRMHLGLFVFETDAAMAYQNAAKKYHGEFAKY